MTVPTIRKFDLVPLGFRAEVPYGSAMGTVAVRHSTLVRVEDEAGTVGWGECFGTPAVLLPVLRGLAAALVGAPIDGAGPYGAQYLGRGYHQTYGGIHVSALSGVDVAMWDLWGRHLGVSVGRLLGGRARDRVLAYGSTGYYFDSDDGFTRFERSLEAVAAEGFAAVKIKVGRGVDDTVRRVLRAREILGRDVHLMVDFNSVNTGMEALRVLQAVAPHQIYWAEEPLHPSDESGLAALRGIGIPLATGEALHTRMAFRELIAGQLVDVVQPDVCAGGGLTEALAVVNMARAWNIRWSPHVWGGAVSIAAALQLCAASPPWPGPSFDGEDLWFEYDQGPNPLRELVPGLGDLHDSWLAIPDGPGLGIELDEEELTRFGSDQFGRERIGT